MGSVRGLKAVIELIGGGNGKYVPKGLGLMKLAIGCGGMGSWSSAARFGVLCSMTAPPDNNPLRILKL